MALYNTTWDGNWDDGDQDDQGLPVYDPAAPVYKSHQITELAIVCIVDALAVIIIIARTYMRKKKLKHLRPDDWWIISAGIVLVCIWSPCQIAANVYGSGLHWKNMTEEGRKKFWIATWGFSGYYIITSLIKVSILHCHLGLLPETFKKFRLCVKGLCVFIMCLGLTETAMWNFDCKPFLSNFVWEIPGDTCLDLDVPRYVWVALSVMIDLIILWIPFRILADTKLAQHEKRALMFVFAANLLGTITCLVGVYGIYMDRWDSIIDSVFTETTFIITNHIEVLMYTLGASFPVLSPYLVAKAGQAHNGRFQLSSFIPTIIKRRLGSGYGFSSENDSAGKESIIMEHRGWEEVGQNVTPIVGVKSSGAEKVEGWAVGGAVDEENQYQRIGHL